ncbi:MAG: UbiA family prenyltransferase [Pirellulales bacterium]|nr:UbiA family prenyltransferase [Pirellulales bacterium]
MITPRTWNLTQRRKDASWESFMITIEQDQDQHTRSTSKMLAYAQLLRLPNVFTAMADVAMGFIFVRDVGDFGHRDLVELALLIAASSSLYLAGMVLNDCYDYESDKKERPQRPLPSGRIGRKTAARLGWGLLACGPILAVAAAFSIGSTRPLSVAVALAVCVVLYDGPLKNTLLGPLAMGVCRMLNVLLGMSAAGIDWGTENWLVAAAVGVYIAGVTFFARTESERSDRGRLLIGITVMMLGVAMLAQLPNYIWLTMTPSRWQMFMALMGVLIAWQSLRAVFNPESRCVQIAVKQAIFSLVMLDAAVVLGVAGAAPALAVLALLIPTVVLGRWVYST